ncbi:MAG: xanthine dehydrogenase family protein subunit M [Planctomycetaceae bacterium]|nr:xanthine dehydrogenase family protein subunit M [Planctomycetaceae bacterium]
MRDFEYEAPASIAEAVRMLAGQNGAARPLAGGTDLIDQIRVGRHQPEVVVDLKKIPELNVLELSSAGLRLGAAVPAFEIYGHEGVAQAYAALVDSARIIGGIQIQSRASIGGNLCNSGPAADSTPSLIALGAVAVIVGPAGKREVAVEEFCTGPGKNVLKPGEFLLELKFPPRPPHSGSSYQRFIPRNEMDIAVVGVGASVVLDERGIKFVSARIGLGAVGPTPYFAAEASQLLAGQPVNEAMIEKAAAATRAIAKPIDDMRGTKEFRMHVTGVLARRVLEQAIARARQ